MTPWPLEDQSALDTPFLTDVLGTLARTPSTNPGDLEAAIAARIVHLLAPTGADVELVETFPTESRPIRSAASRISRSSS